ncbi:MAG: DUF58 domain-containing protein [Spirochaetales bacterium]|nr:DUF58 domain-containing protein [Spirochaetales bacterium]
MTDQGELSRRVKRIQLVSKRLVDTMFTGNYKSLFRGPGLEFDEVRAYIPGDDTRFIDWNVSSRMGETFTKTFKEEREMNLMVLLDASASLCFDSGGSKRDMAGYIFSLIAHAAHANNDRVGSLVFSDKIEQYHPPMKGNKNILKQVSNVLSFSPEGRGSDLALASRTAMELMKRRGICFIISDFKTDGYWKELTLLARKHDVIAVSLYDKQERSLPHVGLVELLDRETGQRQLFHGGSRSLREEYHDFWDLHYYKLEEHCRANGIDYVEIETGEDPLERIIAFFKRRKKR